MFKQSIRVLSARRMLSVTSHRSNLVSELYVSQIKQFKPMQTGNDAVESVKKFQLPSKPAIPSEEVNADAVSSYEAAEVETASVPSGNASAPAAEEDWFVFEEAEAEHH